ncbi:tyrosine-type recombinase/integrase [Sorangium sp. So ce1097]|uniref:tyrosine-type recombinase/integrase n=1 Tax=Sorangium sp. So ce1097 TaxID=3133330 RepID=UPI003F5E1B02
MTIRRTTRRGKPVLVLDIHWQRKDGSQGRYRRDAQVQTMAAARAEERRILANIAQYGEAHEPKPELPEEPEPEKLAATFGQAVELFRSGKAVTKLKPSTRAGYEEILTTRLLPRFVDRPLDGIGFEEVTKLDAEMVKEGLSASRRRNVQAAIRSVLRAAVDAGLLKEMPKLPDLPKTGRKKLPVLTREQVDRIFEVATPSQTIAFSLAVYAGLRSGEVKALRWSDVDLAQGILVVRLSRSKGELSTPKSGHERVVPLAPQLLAVLQGVKKKAGLVSTTRRGQPWAECSLNQALKQAMKKAGIVAPFRFHDLRHFFVTQLFRRGGGAPAVQALAGHLHLSTTQIYAHVVREDLVATIGLLGADGNRTVTPSPASR